MPRYATKHTTQLLFATLLLLLCQGALAAPPNIVLLIADDQAWQDHGFMGHPRIRTPNLDQLAAQGLLFTRGYVPTALCRPSLASLMTGRYPHQHRITGNSSKRQAGEAALQTAFSELPGLAALLGAAGYRSFQGGKWWEGDYASGGFSHGVGAKAAVEMGRKTLQPLFDFIDESGEQPFFLWYAPYLPHFPHEPPPQLLAHYQQAGLHPELAKYYAMIEWTDQTMGELLSHIRRRGKADNTVFIYLADNGWVQPTSPIDNHPWYLGAPRGKGSSYEDGIRTPIILSWPGRIAPRVVDTPVSSLDLPTTLLSLAGQPVPESMQGLNLLDQEAVTQREAVFGASFRHRIDTAAGPAATVLSRWLVSGDWKLIMHQRQRDQAPRVELFNLREDPREADNRSAAEQAKTQQLLDLLDSWWAPLGASTKKGPSIK